MKTIIERNIKINSDRIYLRKIELSDVSRTYVNWLNDSEVNQYLETRYENQTIDSVYKYVQKIIGTDNELLLAMCLQDNHKHIGNIKLGSINLIHRNAEISLFIGDKSEWGKGFATEAISILTNYAFKKLKLHKVTAGCYANNIGSIKAFEKVRFLIEGNWKDHYLYDREYVDRICLAIIDENK